MTRTTAIALSICLLAGCRGSDDEASLPGSGRAGAGAALTGAGATFPYPLYTKWIAEHGKSRPDARINYQSIGSGGGIRQILERTIDFGATDAPMSDEQLAKAEGTILHIPTALGAVALTYNLEGVPGGLKITPEAAAGIYLGVISKWNDPAIASQNPGVSLPDRRITPVHRSDGSGTTKIFTDYLSAVSPTWRGGPGTGTSVSWPVKSSIGAKGNEGVAAAVKSTPGAVGYVELAYAAQTGLPAAAIKNRAGNFVAPTIESITAAAATAKLPEDFRASLVDPPGEQAYPIAGLTYILVYRDQSSLGKGRALVDFLRWSLTEGQKMNAQLHYAPLPGEVASRALEAVGTLRGPGGELLVAR